jgi:hypothetical protein
MTHTTRDSLLYIFDSSNVVHKSMPKKRKEKFAILHNLWKEREGSST